MVGTKPGKLVAEILVIPCRGFPGKTLVIHKKCLLDVAFQCTYLSVNFYLDWLCYNKLIDSPFFYLETE
jgi:hypothetical protein